MYITYKYTITYYKTYYTQVRAYTLKTHVTAYCSIHELMLYTISELW